ncbi:prepilin-type N-terminal cleavage/methylation domain-containing protein [Conexibacter sp. DBS9H8]|uniref:prepilin-type N-terminal cleavage/methylation domain-containing protein n=1 Tax=Conexibacter sp. DBS9H8 TaxID=2937801 RepID=UPI00200CC323|nr:prepilin-type N-terminal cleavage/methylation domain-containing protein [Conexibacter sp. DBS9H8]
MAGHDRTICTCRQRSAYARERLTPEAGFTLIELLVTMVVSIIVLGAGTYGLAQAFKQNTEVIAHAYSGSQGEVGLERLVLDLRQAVNGSCAGVSGIEVAQEAYGNGAVTTVSLCDPSGVPTSYTTTSASQTTTVAGLSSAAEPVIWTCNTANSTYASGSLTVGPESCLRTAAGVTGMEVHGLISLDLTGLVDGSTTPSPITASGATNLYTLNLTAAAGEAGSLSWVGLSAQLADLQDPNNPTDLSTVTASAPFAVHTGASLLNYGT